MGLPGIGALRTASRWWVAYPLLWFIVGAAWFSYFEKPWLEMEPSDWAYISLISVGLLWFDAEVV